MPVATVMYAVARFVHVACMEKQSRISELQQTFKKRASRLYVVITSLYASPHESNLLVPEP